MKKSKHIYLSRLFFDTIISNIRDYCTRQIKWIKEDEKNGFEGAYSLEDVSILENYINDIVNEFSSMRRVTYKKWFKLCHKYIELANVRCQVLASDELQTLWHNGCDYYSTSVTKKYLYNCEPFVKKFNKKDKYMQRVKDVVKHHNETYYRDLELSNDKLVYRNINAVLDKNHRVAFALDITNNLMIFDIEYDWWYPIDRYLDSIHLE